MNDELRIKNWFSKNLSALGTKKTVKFIPVSFQISSKKKGYKS